jgi:competence protein ComGC
MELIFALVIYSILILLFVPLDKIGRMQKWIHKQVRKLSDKIGE